MQTYPTSSGDNVAGFEPSPSLYQPPQTPLPPPPYQSQPVGFGKAAEAATAPENYTVSPSYGYTQPAALQPQMPDNQNFQMNMISLTVPQPVVARSVVIVQQQAIFTPPSFLCWSIFSFIWFWPLGLAAVICSAKVTSTQSPADARRYSTIARNLNFAAFVIGPLVVAVVLGSMAATTKVSAANGVYNPFVRYYSYKTSFSYLATYSGITYARAYSYYGDRITVTSMRYASYYHIDYMYSQGVL